MQPIPTPVPPDNVSQIQRPGRVLIGWMPEKEAVLWLASRRADLQQQPQYLERARNAAKIVASRSGPVDQADALTPPPPAVIDHFAIWSQHPAAAQFLAEGWVPAVADLTKICAVQPLVYTDYPQDRIETLSPDNFGSLAQVTIPIPSQNNLVARFDESQRAWIFSSPNPNLRVAGQFSATLQPGIMGFGFAVTLSPSFMQVASFQGRLLLRDGYHRAVALLQRGITQVPVIHKEFNTSTELSLPQGLFPFDVFLGQNPPFLSDYGDEEVSASVAMPIVQKVLVIHAINVDAAM
jgi:hypothetical protein